MLKRALGCSFLATVACSGGDNSGASTAPTPVSATSTTTFQGAVAGTGALAQSGTLSLTIQTPVAAGKSSARR